LIRGETGRRLVAASQETRLSFVYFYALHRENRNWTITYLSDRSRKRFPRIVHRMRRANQTRRRFVRFNQQLSPALIEKNRRGTVVAESRTVLARSAQEELGKEKGK
jgi:hypothetical protein